MSSVNQCMRVFACTHTVFILVASLSCDISWRPPDGIPLLVSVSGSGALDECSLYGPASLYLMQMSLYRYTYMHANTYIYVYECKYAFRRICMQIRIMQISLYEMTETHMAFKAPPGMEEGSHVSSPVASAARIMVCKSERD